MSLFPPRRRDIPLPYEGADMGTHRASWVSDAEEHLRDTVRRQRARIKWLESELARVEAFVYQAVGE